MADSIDLAVEKMMDEIHRPLPLYTEAAAEKARREALEEAARVAEAHYDVELFRECGRDIAAAIRAL